MSGTGSDITLLLQRSAGDPQARSALIEAVYDQLRILARARMAGERRGHTLDATGLVHEAFVRLLGDADVSFRDRAHFFHAAAQCMRRILVDHARARGAEKRGGGLSRLPASMLELAEAPPDQVLQLDDAITALSREDERAAHVVYLRFYAGLEVDDVADIMQVSPRTVKRDAAWARARLMQIIADRHEPNDAAD